MTRISHTLFWMTAYLGTVGGVCVLLYQPLQAAFLANWVFNSLILSVLVIGILINYRQVFILLPEIEWIKMFRTGKTGISVSREPKLLRSLARTLEGRVKDRFSLSALSLRTVLDGIRSRLDESREISRYMVGLLIFLGLLGTFWGLLSTIGAVSQVIDGLKMGEDTAFAAVFADLKAGLQAPLQGMGTAFSSSLLGLGGSLILGFMDLQVSHAQNRFFDGLEEWLSGVTQLLDESQETDARHAAAMTAVSHKLSTLIQELRTEQGLLREVLRQPRHGEPPDAD